MNDYTCTCSCGCQNSADDFVCHNCKIGMCKVGLSRNVEWDMATETLSNIKKKTTKGINHTKQSIG